ncbi:MAG: transcription-repair coupling factor [Chloroflexi bacterium]|nr:transcription-repair coupling factor [Chloroflexota bacterium]
MSLANLLPLLDLDRQVTRLTERLTAGAMTRVTDLVAAARPLVLAHLAWRLERPVLVLVSRPDHAAAWTEALLAYAPPGLPVDVWPAPDTIPYERLPRDPAKSAQRVNLLGQWAVAGSVAAARILVVPARGLMQMLPLPDDLRAASVHLRLGDDVSLSALARGWTAAGYEAVSVVEEPGRFSRRGGIIDIWPPTSDVPVRMELWGDTIDSLRLFDPATQRSAGRIEEIVVPPPVEMPAWEIKRARSAIDADADLSVLRREARDEWGAALERLASGDLIAELDLLAPYLLTRPVSLLDYAPANALIVVDEPDSVGLAGVQIETQAEELREQFERQGELPANLRQPYHRWSVVADWLARRVALQFGAAPAHAPAADVLEITDFQAAPVFGGQLDRLADLVADRIARRQRTVLVSEQSQRLSELLAERDIFTVTRKRLPRPAPGDSRDSGDEALVPPTPGTVEVMHADLSGGWGNLMLETLLLTDLELFGWQRQRRALGRRSATAARAFLDRLRPGDHVVHIEHGIAVYSGLVTREAGGVEREFMLLQYAGADRLYVPVDQTDRVVPYGGPSGAAPALNRLGSPEWERTKRRVRKAVADLAQDLLAVYATRAVVDGHAYPPDTQWQTEMEEAFPYQETPDQQRAIDEVKTDMEAARPMDRLICGDVGYGKTEVALRAAFKAVNDGRQVAVLVPTTVLALQHFETFSQRLSAFPVTVEMLSRLRSKRLQTATVAGLADGRVDIVIGTHRLLQRDVRFRRLGLVIVDEEQRFGVRHKERLKQLRTEVDVLTLSATPIPRTLHMGLVGVRDMSLIETPPEARLPIRTFVRPESDDLVREVILREIDRGGQIFFVHNRVQSIAHVAHRLRELLPEGRFLIGHGQMDEQELEQVMLAFVRHEADVLICTTIIESGLDMPNVNTLIVDDATHFGLAQLYQLRGRVGRSSNRAYAYLLYDPTRPMTPDAQERLETIQEATELGSGFRVALKDLELRGAGNLLGAEQHGHVEAVGFDLYTRMLAQAVEGARGAPPPADLPPLALDLPLDAHLPVEYVADPDVRLSLYQRLAQPADLRALTELEREIIDRFGPLPPPTRNLIDVVSIKNRALAAGISSIGQGEGEIVIRPVPTSLLDQRAVQRIGPGAVKLTPSTVRLDMSRLGDGWLAALKEVLTQIERVRDDALAADDRARARYGSV